MKLLRWPMDTEWGSRHKGASAAANGLVLAVLILFAVTVAIWAIGWLWSGGRVDT